MKLREILQLCYSLCGMGTSSTFGPNDEATAYANKQIKMLSTLCQFVADELYCQYGTALRKTVVEAEDCFVDTTTLNLVRVVKLEDSQGESIPYRYTDNGLYVNANGKLNLTYAQSAPALKWDEEVVMPSPTISNRIFVYGVVCEYFDSINDVENSRIWNEKYTNALMCMRSKRSKLVLPVRRWL